MHAELFVKEGVDIAFDSCEKSLGSIKEGCRNIEASRENYSIVALTNRNSKSKKGETIIFALEKIGENMTKISITSTGINYQSNSADDFLPLAHCNRLAFIVYV